MAGPVRGWIWKKSWDTERFQVWVSEWKYRGNGLKGIIKNKVKSYIWKKKTSETVYIISAKEPANDSEVSRI